MALSLSTIAHAGTGVWTTGGPYAGDVVALAFHPVTSTTVYAVTHFAGVFRSVDSGGTWVAANEGLPHIKYLQGYSLAIDPLTPATLYAGMYFAIFKSIDSGSTSTAVSVGLTNLYVRALAIHPTAAATLYAGTDGRGVFKSLDSGAAWIPVNKGLPSSHVERLAIDPTGATTVYAGLFGDSVWQATPPTAVKSDLSLTLSDSPDPVTGTTPLSYTLSVTNIGPDPAGPVSVTHTLPAGVAFDSARGSGWTCGQAGGVVSCTRPELVMGPAPPISVLVTPGPDAAVLVSFATVSVTEVDPNPANNSDSETTTVNQALVWLGLRTKTVFAPSDRFIANEDVTYTITLTNSGLDSQADNPGPEFQDMLPSSLALVSANATSGTATADLSGNSVTWNGSLPSGGSVTVTIRATIKPTVPLGTTVANQGTAYYDPDGNGTNEATVLTDDPGEPGANDPTSFVVVSPPTDLYTLPPCRLLDTRDAAGTFGGPALVANAERVFPLFDRCGIPSTARALFVNLTVTEPAAAGHLRLHPAGTALPLVSSIN